MAIIDNDEKSLSDLGRLVHSTEGLECSGLYSGTATAPNEIRFSTPDVVLMEINIPLGSGIQLLRSIKEICPKTLILVLSHIDAPKAVVSALAAGAVGYILKQSSPAQIITAIQNVYRGGSPMTDSFARQLVGLFQQAPSPRNGFPGLSLRQQQVLELLAKGRRYKEIAGELQISYATAHTHIRQIYKKLRVTSRTDAVVAHLRQTAGCQNEGFQIQAHSFGLFGREALPAEYAHCQV